MKMIVLYDADGRKHLVAKTAIVRITEAQASSQWHGTKCFVQLMDGTRIGATEDVQTIRNRIEADED
jgi:hypothetical protein